MGIFDDIFGGGDKTTTVRNELPAFVTEGGEFNNKLARAIASGQWPDEVGAYPRYAGPRVAALSPHEEMASLWGLGAIGRESGLPAAGVQIAAQGQAPVREFNAENVQQFQTPYLDTILGNIRREGEMARSSIRARAPGGAWGGSRSAVVEGLQRESEGRSVADASARSFDNAVSSFFRQGEAERAGAGQSMELSRLLTQIGESAQQQRLRDLTSLLSVGQLGRQHAQQQIDVDHGDFVEARDWPARMLSLLTSTLSGTPVERTQTTTAPGGSAAGNILGSLAAIAGIGGPSGFGVWGRGA